jgi:hypothetical protein
MNYIEPIVDTFVFGVVYRIGKNAQDIFVVIQDVSSPYALLDPVVRQRIVLLYIYKPGSYNHTVKCMTSYNFFV